MSRPAKTLVIAASCTYLRAVTLTNRDTRAS